jgi:hypothetical protein
MIAISGQIHLLLSNITHKWQTFPQKETEMLPKARYLYILYLCLGEYGEGTNHIIDSNTPNTKIPDCCPIGGHYLCRC